MERVATLSDIERHWSFAMITDTNQVLDAWQAAESRAMKRANGR